MGERSHEKPNAEDLDAGDLRVAVVVSRYNVDVSRRLLRGALDALEEHGAVDPEVIGVPGAVEIPLAVLTTMDRDQALARSGAKNNKGAEAAETAVEMANLIRRLQERDD